MNYLKATKLKFLGKILMVLALVLSIGLYASTTVQAINPSDKFTISVGPYDYGDDRFNIHVQTDLEPLEDEPPFNIMAFSYVNDSTISCSKSLADLNRYNKDTFKEAGISDNAYQAFNSRLTFAWFRYDEDEQTYTLSERYDDYGKHTTVSGSREVQDKIRAGFIEGRTITRLCIMVETKAGTSLTTAEYDINAKNQTITKAPASSNPPAEPRPDPTPTPPTSPPETTEPAPAEPDLDTDEDPTEDSLIVGSQDSDSRPPAATESHQAADTEESSTDLLPFIIIGAVVVIGIVATLIIVSNKKKSKQNYANFMPPLQPNDSNMYHPPYPPTHNMPPQYQQPMPPNHQPPPGNDQMPPPPNMPPS